MSNIILGHLVESEGYCCMHGYLRLCKARGETPDTMAEHMGVSPSTVKYHYARLADEKRSHRCSGGPGCMKELWEKKED